MLEIVSKIITMLGSLSLLIGCTVQSIDDRNAHSQLQKPEKPTLRLSNAGGLNLAEQRFVAEGSLICGSHETNLSDLNRFDVIMEEEYITWVADIRIENDVPSCELSLTGLVAAGSDGRPVNGGNPLSCPTGTTLSASGETTVVCSNQTSSFEVRASFLSPADFNPGFSNYTQIRVIELEIASSNESFQSTVMISGAGTSQVFAPTFRWVLEGPDTPQFSSISAENLMGTNPYSMDLVLEYDSSRFFSVAAERQVLHGNGSSANPMWDDMNGTIRVHLNDVLFSGSPATATQQLTFMDGSATATGAIILEVSEGGMIDGTPWQTDAAGGEMVGWRCAQTISCNHTAYSSMFCSGETTIDIRNHATQTICAESAMSAESMFSVGEPSCAEVPAYNSQQGLTWPQTVLPGQTQQTVFCVNQDPNGSTIGAIICERDFAASCN